MKMILMVALLTCCAAAIAAPVPPAKPAQVQKTPSRTYYVLGQCFRIDGNGKPIIRSC